MPTPDDPRLEELRDLRTRAYGPHADIHEDAAALARLRELEADASGAVADPAIRTPTTGPRVEPTASDASAPADDGHTSAAGSVTPTGPATAVESPAWWRRRVPLLWTAAGVFGGLVIGAGSMLLVQPTPPQEAAFPHADPDAEWPNQMSGASPEDGQRYNEFHGLTVVTYDQNTGDGASRPCLAVLTTPSGAGFAAGGCGAGPFPATVSLQITSLLPQALRDEFPEDTSLQFVHDDARVQVYAAQPTTARPNP